MATETHRRMNGMAAVAVVLTLVLAGGCAKMNELIKPGALSGFMTPRADQKQLEEPAFYPTAHPYTADAAARKRTAPVRLNVPDRDAICSVACSRNDYEDTLYFSGSFAAGKIIEREFGKVIAANFREPAALEAPAAQLTVRLFETKVWQPSVSSGVEAKLQIHLELAKPDRSETAYSKTFDATESAVWTNRSLVPESFYLALSNIVVKFLADWSADEGAGALALWAGAMPDGVVPPRLRDIEWVANGGDVQRGRCVIDCNGYEGFQAQQWAHDQIQVACRSRLGNLPPERLRVIYEGETYDKSGGTWTFSFQCFARSKTVLQFDPVTGFGTVIGDLDLMNLPAAEAADVLKRYVLKEMKAHSGVVADVDTDSKAFVRFDSFTTNTKYNLIVIEFRLLR